MAKQSPRQLAEQLAAEMEQEEAIALEPEVASAYHEVAGRLRDVVAWPGRVTIKTVWSVRRFCHSAEITERHQQKARKAETLLRCRDRLDTVIQTAWEASHAHR